MVVGAGVENAVVIPWGSVATTPPVEELTNEEDTWETPREVPSLATGAVGGAAEPAFLRCSAPDSQSNSCS